MTTLKGIFPNPKPTRRKNYIHENVKNLRRMEQFFHNKEIEDLQKLQLQKKPMDKYQNVRSRINSSLRGRKQNSLGKSPLRHSDNNLAEGTSPLERKVSEPIEKTNLGQRKIQRTPLKSNLGNKSKDARIKAEKGRNVKRVPSNPDFLREASTISESHERDYVKYRNQGIQTVDTDNVETLYKEGVIRYPSARSSKNVSPPGKNIEGLPQRECPSSLSEKNDAYLTSALKRGSDRTDSSPVNGDQADHAKFNKANSSIASKMATQLNNGVLPTNYRKGVVPKYIRDRKEAQQQKEERIKAAASHPDCPEGHVPLPDDERKETLRMLKKRHQEFVSELNMMPIRTDTLRSQRRKMEIEKQLTKLEEGIKVFSRPKVYVKVNA